MTVSAQIKQLKNEIAQLEEQYNSVDTPDAIKDLLKGPLGNARNQLFDLEKLEKQEDTATPPVPAKVKKEKAQTTKIVKLAKQIVKKVKVAKAAKEGSPARKRTLKQIVSGSSALARAYAHSSEKQLRADASRKAKKPGTRTSASGKKYREYRPNRTDVNDKAPYLAKGGKASKADVLIEVYGGLADVTRCPKTIDCFIIDNDNISQGDPYEYEGVSYENSKKVIDKIKVDYASTKKKYAIITVYGGVADIEANSKGVTVDILDHDNEEDSAELVDFDSMYNGKVKAYRSTQQPDLYFYAGKGPEGKNFIVTSEVVGFPATEAFDDWLAKEEDAIAIAKKLAEGKDPNGDEYAAGGKATNKLTAKTFHNAAVDYLKRAYGLDPNDMDINEADATQAFNNRENPRDYIDYKARKLDLDKSMDFKWNDQTALFKKYGYDQGEFATGGGVSGDSFTIQSKDPFNSDETPEIVSGNVLLTYAKGHAQSHKNKQPKTIKQAIAYLTSQNFKVENIVEGSEGHVYSIGESVWIPSRGSNGLTGKIVSDAYTDDDGEKVQDLTLEGMGEAVETVLLSDIENLPNAANFAEVNEFNKHVEKVGHLAAELNLSPEVVGGGDVGIVLYTDKGSIHFGYANGPLGYHYIDNDGRDLDYGESELEEDSPAKAQADFIRSIANKHNVDLTKQPNSVIYSNFHLVIDDITNTNLDDFISANEETMSNDEMDKVKTLKPGQAVEIGVHAGWSTIKRLPANQVCYDGYNTTNLTHEGFTAFQKAFEDVEDQKGTNTRVRDAMKKLVSLVDQVLARDGVETAIEAHKALQEIGIYNYRTGLVLDTAWLNIELALRQLKQGGRLMRSGGRVDESAVKKYLYNQLEAAGVDVEEFKHKVAQLNMDLHYGCHEEDFGGFTTTKDLVDKIIDDADISDTLYYDKESGDISELEPDGGYTDEDEDGEWAEEHADWREVNSKYILLGDVAGYFAKGGRIKSALMRDRKYRSNEPWEQSYRRVGRKNPRYAYSTGGKISDGNKVPEIAMEFSRLLRKELTAEQMDQIISTNKKPGYAPSCATHNYLDANMTMHEAFTNVMGRDFIFYNEEYPQTEKQNEADTTLLNLAWDLAKKNEFSTKPPKITKEQKQQIMIAGIHLHNYRRTFTQHQAGFESIGEILGEFKANPTDFGNYNHAVLLLMNYNKTLKESHPDKKAVEQAIHDLKLIANQFGAQNEVHSFNGGPADVYFKDEGDFIQACFLTKRARHAAGTYERMAVHPYNNWKVAINGKTAARVKETMITKHGLVVDDSEINYEEFAAGGEVKQGKQISFKDTGKILRILDSGDLLIRDASGNNQTIPAGRIIQVFAKGGPASLSGNKPYSIFKTDQYGKTPLPEEDSPEGKQLKAAKLSLSYVREKDALANGLMKKKDARKLLERYGLRADDKYAGGGSTGRGRDRRFKSQEPHEQVYKRKTSPKNPRYKRKKQGRQVAKKYIGKKN